MNKKLKIAGSVIIAVIIVAIVVVGLLSVRQKTITPEIRVADAGAIGWAPLYVALDKGMFEHQGVKVTLLPVQSGDESVKAVMSGSADVALAGILPYSFAAYDYPELKIFAQTGAAHDAQMISSADRKIKNPADLKGKKIAYAKNTASDMDAHQFLQNNGLTEGDVQLVALKPLAMLPALVSGQIDAYSAWEPNVMNARKTLGDKFIVFAGASDTYTWHPATIANANYISKNRSALVKFIKAWKEADNYMKSNPDESIAIVASHVKVAPEDLKSAWGKYEFFVKADSSTASILSIDLKWANSRREKPVAQIPVSDNLIDLTILNEINK